MRERKERNKLIFRGASEQAMRHSGQSEETAVPAQALHSPTTPETFAGPFVDHDGRSPACIICQVRRGKNLHPKNIHDNVSSGVKLATQVCVYVSLKQPSRLRISLQRTPSRSDASFVSYRLISHADLSSMLDSHPSSGRGGTNYYYVVVPPPATLRANGVVSRHRKEKVLDSFHYS